MIDRNDAAEQLVKLVEAKAKLLNLKSPVQMTDEILKTGSASIELPVRTKEAPNEEQPKG